MAEGWWEGQEAEMRRFVQIARGSANEVEYHLLLAKDSRGWHKVVEAKILDVQHIVGSAIPKPKRHRFG